MTVARWLETDSNSNIDISGAAAIGAYTADADRLIVVDVSLDAVAGNGDYVIYVTRQINGAGSAYVMLPKTTCAAASGETAIAMQSGMISVRSGDVLTCYVDGLAGDTTTPDTTVRWFEMAALRPVTADRQVVIGADGSLTTVTNLTNLPAAAALEATLDEIKGAGWTTETLVQLFLQGEDTQLITSEAKADILAILTNAIYGMDKLARTGADGDTLETLSDQIDGTALETTAQLILEDTETTLPAAIADLPTAAEIDTELSGTHGSGTWAASGSGTVTWTYALTSSVDDTPIADADVWVTTDVGGSNVIASGQTDQYGEVAFELDPGTIYVWRQKSGWNFSNPDTEVVV